MAKLSAPDLDADTGIDLLLTAIVPAAPRSGIAALRALPVPAC